MIKDFNKLETLLTDRAKELANGCKKVFVAVSGGVDSSLVAAVLCKAFGPENVVGLHRNVRSNPKHLEDVRSLQSVLGFKLLVVDGNEIYDNLLNQLKKQFNELGLPWAQENTTEAEQLGFTNAYASLKSRLTTPMAGFIAKAVDNGNGRIFGTGNGEEDSILRYFDKYGDGAVDNNILNGLTKGEVKQMAAYMSVPQVIVTKIPSADLEANGDKHNDEGQLTKWAKDMGLDIKISYGSEDGSQEGNIAWAWKEDIKNGVVTGGNKNKTAQEMGNEPFNYSDLQTKTVLFLRAVDKSTKHKVSPIPGLERSVLTNCGAVD